jgi:hypothetical protein
MALNGWQRITRVNGNSLMSWGTQIQFKPCDKVLINYSNFIGTDNRIAQDYYAFFITCMAYSVFPIRLA